MGSYEFAEWLAYAEVEPFGIAVDDYRAGLMPALTVNGHATGGAKLTSPRDFFPWAPKSAPAKPAQLSPEETSRFIRERIFKVVSNE